jgi:hypothetical protein
MSGTKNARRQALQAAGLSRGHWAADAAGAAAVGRLVGFYKLATAEQLRDGLAWYGTANAAAVLVAAAGGWTVEQGAAVVAAFSPSTAWDVNLQLASSFSVGVPAEVLTTMGATGAMLDAANRIAAGVPINEVLKTKKVWNFYLGIVSSGAEGVCVDRHAASAACGFKLGEWELGALANKGTFDGTADAFRAGAAAVGVFPAAFQAVVWTVWRDATAYRSAGFVPVLTSP